MEPADESERHVFFNMNGEPSWDHIREFFTGKKP